MSFEYKGGSIHHLVTIPAPHLHSRGINVTLGFEFTHERCAAPAAQPLLFLFVVYSRTPLTGRWGDKVIPPGADRIPPRVLGTDERRARMFRHGNERATRISGIQYYAGIGKGDLPRISLAVGAMIRMPSVNIFSRGDTLK
jgi:hypothetical protein